jgi:hypothetical protein
MNEWVRGQIVYKVQDDKVTPWGKILFLVTRDHVMVQMYDDAGNLSDFARTMNVCEVFEYGRENRFIKVSEIKEGAWER